MSAQHTPGPWLAAAAGSSIVGIPVVARGGRAIASLHFAFEGVPGREAYNTEQLANARLIAAAPEQHALLAEFMSHQDQAECHNCDGDDADCPADCWERRARALLAKVDGK